MLAFLWKPGKMTLSRLKWITVAAPVLFFGFLAFLDRMIPLMTHPWLGYVLTGLLVLVLALFFSEAVFGIIGRLQAGLAQQNRELLALHQAGLDIAGELRVEVVLQKIVDQARELVGARYGALLVPGQDGGTEAFLTSGISTDDSKVLPSPPGGDELLGLVAKGQTLRLSGKIHVSSRMGIPADNSPVYSLLAAPILSGGRVLGLLYLLEKETASEFSLDDEETLVRFATQAALAIENARLHRRVRELAITEERQRIAREMHDSLAQVLGYVNTKAQASLELLRAGQDERAAAQIAQLAEAARTAYADVREDILGLRTSLSQERDFVETLRDYLVRWQEQSQVPVELELPTPAPQIKPAAELQLIRIVQEALANVRKHAAARHAWVRIASRNGQVEVVVEDDGSGFDPSALGRGTFPRFGLATMRERVESVGGDLEIDSAPGKGTRVVVRLPADTAQAQAAGDPYARAHR